MRNVGMCSVKVPWSMNDGRASRWSIHRMLSHGAVIKCEYVYTTWDRLSRESERGRKNEMKEKGKDGAGWFSFVLT